MKKPSLTTVFSVCIFLIGVILIIGTYREKVDNNEKGIVGHDAKIEKNVDKIQTLEKYDIKQSAAIDKIQVRAIQQVEQIQVFQANNARQLKIIERLEEKIK